VFTNWRDASLAVTGVKGMHYRKVASRELAAAFLDVQLDELEDGDKWAAAFRRESAATAVPASLTEDAAPCLDVFTDGGCSRNGTREAAAGFGVVIMRGGEVLWQRGAAVPFCVDAHPTNIYAEFMAVQVACEQLLLRSREWGRCVVFIHVDLKLALTRLTCAAADIPPDAAHRGLIRSVRALLRMVAAVYGHAPRVMKVKAHSGVLGNDIADAEATKGVAQYTAFVAAATAAGVWCDATLHGGAANTGGRAQAREHS
jgi:ribonuclease HI